MAVTSMMDHPADPNKFDLRTHFWDSQGILVKKNLYTLYVIAGEQYFERPVGSGNLWTGGNQPAGRMIDGKVHGDVEHVEFTPDLHGAEAEHFQLEQMRTKTAALEAELAAIKAERAPKEDVKKSAAPLAATMTEPTLRSKGS